MSRLIIGSPVSRNRSPHILLVGEGAKRFALSYGFKEEDLLTDTARQAWLEWRANMSPGDNYLDVPAHTPMEMKPVASPQR